MSNSISAGFPDISTLLSASGNLQGTVHTLLDTLGALDPQKASSPLAGIQGAFGGLAGVVNVDISPLSQQLPAALQSIQNALPENALSSLESIEEVYRTVRNVLNGNPLAQQITSGGSLQDVGLAVIAEARQLFDQRLSDLTSGLIDSEALASLQAFFTAIDGFKSDFASHQAELLPFVANHLLGVDADVFSAPLAHLDSAFAVLAPLDENALAASLGTVRQGVMAAYSTLLSETNSFDPADANAYVQIQAQLTALESANSLAFTALNTLYQSLETLIANHAWDSIFGLYVGLLQAISFKDVFTVDDLVSTLSNLLEEMLARLTMAFSADDLRQRLDLLSQSIREAVISSPLGQVRQSLQTFLDDIRQAIESIPTESIQQTVDGLFQRIQGELDALHISQAQQEITQAFQNIETFINSHINEALKTDVRGALSPLVSQVQNLPLAGLISQLNNAIAALQGVIDELQNALNAEIDNLNDLLSQLEGLSFKPVSDEVIGEIDDLKARLEAINPDSLSDVEKLAIAGALAVLRAIDLEGKVIGGLKQAYHQAEGEVKSLLDQLNAALEGFSGRFQVFSPEALLSPVNDLFSEADSLAASLNGQNLLGFLYDLLGDLQASLEALDPGRILDPLQAPYDELMSAVNRLDPAAWVAPLQDLYAEIDEVISLIDVTPLLDELDNLQKELFSNVRTLLLNALDGLNLPEPLGSFFAQVRPVLEIMTDAIFGDPNTELRHLSLEIQNRVNLSSLFAPLDTAFLELVQLLENLPPDQVTTVMNTIRQSVGIGLEALNPQNILSRFRSAYGRLAGLAPNNLLGVALGLPTLKLNFEARASAAPPARQADVAAVSARFDVVINGVAPSLPAGQMTQLIQAHNNLLGALRRRINALDSSSASQNYAQLRRSLDKLLPDFLRQAQPLTYADIIAGLYSMRPSTKARQFEVVLERFLKHVQPIADALEPGINHFFTTLHDLIGLINPLNVKDAVTAIYAEVRAKVRIIDPEDLRQRLEGLLNSVTAPLQAIDPSQIKAQINAVYNSALAAVTNGVKAILDDLVAIVDDALRNIKTALKGLIAQIKAAITATLHDLEAVLGRVEQLVFVDILARLGSVIDNLGMSFDAELDRVRNSFDAMLSAIPLDSSASVSVGI
jgi:hypothetical protein